MKTSACVIEYRELETRILAALRADLREEEFAALALAAHAFQKRWNPPYANFCATRPPTAHWREIPAVPQSAFKTARLSCFAPAQTPVTFRTSGTTGETRGEHHFLDTRLYDAAVLAGWDRLGMKRIPQTVLAPHPLNTSHSSLAHMFRTLQQRGFGSALHCISDDGILNGEMALASLEWHITNGLPVGVFGTALAFLNFFEMMAERRLTLSAGSYALETGGYKGSGREIPKAELYAMFGEYLGLAPDDVINEYGMTELSSQFYTRGLGGVHEGPPWVRTVVIDPETGGEVAVGETGVLRIFDLANLGSVLAVETQDLAVRRERGFELLGRDPAALPRGCSRAADERMRA